MMNSTRQINLNCYVNAELPTKNIKTDIHFINQIEINFLVRDLSFKKRMFYKNQNL
jgi:hypothetical protein